VFSQSDRHIQAGWQPETNWDSMIGYKGSHSKKDQGKQRSRIFLILGCLLIVASLVIAGLMFYKYIHARWHNAGMALTAGSMSIRAGSDVPADLDADSLNINWEALQAINPDIIAWVLVPGTNINYPVVKGQDNEYYLTHLADGAYSPAGAIFADAEGTATLDAQSNFIYGHNMLDGTMFSDITKFNDADFFAAHRRVIICTPAGQMELTTVAILECSASAEVRRLEFSNDADFANYFRELLGYAVNSDEEARKEAERIYCLSTCTDYGNVNRSILVAKPTVTTMGELSSN